MADKIKRIQRGSKNHGKDRDKRKRGTGYLAGGRDIDAAVDQAVTGPAEKRGKKGKK